MYPKDTGYGYDYGDIIVACDSDYYDMLDDQPYPPGGDQLPGLAPNSIVTQTATSVKD